MPVYHFILHAYGTWHPDHPLGYYQHDSPGRKPPNPNLATHRRATQNHLTLSFSNSLQHQLIERTLTFCTNGQLRPLAIATTPTHLHALIAWTHDYAPKRLQSSLKRSLALLCARHESTPDRQWFSKGGLPLRVKNHAHLTQLLESYLPAQGGLLWREGEPIRQVHGTPRSHDPPEN